MAQVGWYGIFAGLALQCWAVTTQYSVRWSRAPVRNHCCCGFWFLYFQYLLLLLLQIFFKLLLWVRRFFLCCSLYSSARFVCVYIYIYIYTLIWLTLLWILFPIVRLLSLGSACVSDNSPQPGLFSVIWGTLLVGPNDKCLFNCRY